MARKSIAKSVRFEVFKRDSFRCQYCGAAAPNVLLEIDHIDPVANGGNNEILNLITACTDCNAGKRDRKLDDLSAVARQREQLEELNQRREQLEMMVEWKRELAKLSNRESELLQERWQELVPGYHLNDRGRDELAKLVKRFGFEEVFDVMGISTEQYLERDRKGAPTKASVEKAFDYVGRICVVRRSEKKHPHLKGISYTLGVLRNRLADRYLNKEFANRLMKEAVESGADIKSIKDFAKTVTSWSQFRDELERFIDSRAPTEQT
ncbi:MAG: hypothetical protein CHACPFDD_02115 [Phycisphaerae bacterium]|nr:hypothetical protein [Phycisphaerae bacterium]